MTTSTNKNKNINVEVKRILNVSPKEAQQAWYSYHFEKGGDLPLLFVSTTNNKKRRLLLPAMLEETLLPPPTNNNNKDDSLSVAYTVSDFGPLLGLDFVPGSHLGTVTFIPIKNTTNDNYDETTVTKTEMIWKVSCQTKQRVPLWNLVTTYLITTVCDNLMEYTSIPYLYTKTTMLPNVHTLVSEKWKSFVWKQGGKLPFCYPPISFYDDGNTRMYFPPGLMERITKVISNKNVNEIHYRVVNPGYVSFYPVYSHKGRVRFIPEGNVLKMIWQVEIRPKKPYSLVKGFTSTVVSTLSQNFQQHLLPKDQDSSFLWREEDQDGEWIQSEMPP